MLYVDKIKSFYCETCWHLQLPLGCKGLTRSYSCFAPSFNQAWSICMKFKCRIKSNYACMECYVVTEMVHFVSREKAFRFSQQRNSCDVTYANGSSIMREWSWSSVCLLQVCQCTTVISIGLFVQFGFLGFPKREKICIYGTECIKCTVL